MFDLADFIRESNRIEGIEREPGDPQLVRELFHTRLFVTLKHVTVRDLEHFVAICTGAQHHPAELRRRVGMDVRVGNHVAPLGGHEIEVRLETILRNLDRLTPFQTHIEYESLHPFTDGNGRSGRALWLWQMGGAAPLGFLHRFYYQTLEVSQQYQRECGL